MSRLGHHYESFQSQLSCLKLIKEAALMKHKEGGNLLRIMRQGYNH